MATSFLNRYQGNIFQILLLFLVLVPSGMFVSWFLTPKRPLVVAIIDKTVLTKNGQEHISLNWILTQEKFSKNREELYNPEQDYFGFFPGDNESFQTKGLESLSKNSLNELSNETEVVYNTDSYGIYRNEWYKVGEGKERSGIIYGGMSKQDLFFLQQMKAKHKLIITEFNCLGSPTDTLIRRGFENTFGIHWTGWIGRYFNSFDTLTNKELPRWLINNYRLQHKGSWPFHKSGIALIHSNDQIVILEKGSHINQELPYIFSSKEGVEHYGLSPKIKYGFWFDILTVDSAYNHVIAEYRIDVNENGKKELSINHIPFIFPAITAHINTDYRFFYFSGDFCDNPITLTSSYFKGVKAFNWFLYNERDIQERNSFFWLFYRPLVTTVLNDYYTSIH